MLNGFTSTALRQHLRDLFATQPLTIGDQTFGQDVTDEAIEELVAAMVRSYMGEGGPTACEKVVGALFLSLLPPSKVTTPPSTRP